MKVRIARTLVTALVVEILAIATLVVAVALFGPSEAEAAQEWAGQTGRWLGPVAGFIFCVFGGWFVARGAAAEHVVHGLLLGAVVAAIDIGLLLAGGSEFETVFVLSNVGRLIAGALGGWLAGRS